MVQCRWRSILGEIPLQNRPRHQKPYSRRSRDIKGKDPDHATRDLHDAIKRGEYPSWTLQMQLMPVKDAESYRFDVFDVTKVWTHSDYPQIDVGKIVMNSNT